MNRVYRFADCELRPVAPMLLRGGEPVEISGQALALLRYLVERPGEMVEKSELLQQVWGHSHITDAAFARAIMRTRQAVGDDGQTQQVIRTVHRRGVMLVAEVVVVDFEPASQPPMSAPDSKPDLAPTPAPSAAPAPSVQSGAPTASAPKKSTAWRVWPVALVLATGLLAAGLAWWPLPPVDPIAGPMPAVATERLLLLREVEAAPDDEALGELAQAMPGVLQLLLRDDGIRLLEATEVKEGFDPVAADGRPSQHQQLPGFSGADIVLDIALQQVDAGLLASYSLSGKVSQQRQIREPDTVALTRSLVTRLRRDLSGVEVDAVRDSGVLRDPLLTELTLRARAARARGDEQAAIKAYDAAIAMAPELPRLAFERIQVDIEEGLPSADASTRLLALLDERSDALSDIERADILHSAGLHAWYGGDPARAAELLQEALQLAESGSAQVTAAIARNSLAMAQHSAGQLHEAWQNSSLAVAAFREQQRPYLLSQVLTTLGYFAEDRGRLDESGRLHREALELRERYGFTQLTGASYYALARVARRQGSLHEAERLIRQASVMMLEAGQQLSNIDALEELAEVLLRQGRYREALAALDEAESQVGELEDELGLAWLQDVRGRVLLTSGDASGAVPLMRGSAATQARLGQHFEATHTRIALADALDASGGAQRVEAAALRHKLATEAEGMSHDQRVALAVVELRAARRAGELKSAKEDCVRALELARTSGTADREADAAIECGLVHLASGNHAEARRMLTLAQRWNSGYPPLQELARQLSDQPENI